MKRVLQGEAGGGKVLKILDCEPGQSSELSAPPGSVLAGGAVACAGGTTLQIKSLQLTGKKETALSDFVNGYLDFEGSLLT